MSGTVIAEPFVPGHHSTAADIDWTRGHADADSDKLLAGRLARCDLVVHGKH